MIRFIGFILLVVLLCSGCATGEPSSEAESTKVLFDFGWKFKRGEIPGAENPGFDDSSWEEVDLPHDWSIEGPFSRENPAFSRGAWLPAGKGVYRKTFRIRAEKKERRYVICFDGVYRNSSVYINGHLLGERPLGYIAFNYDMTEHLNFGRENVLTVKVDNSSQPGSRWYTGSGIYRHVWLISTGNLYVPVWDNYIVANEVKDDAATIKLETRVVNDFEVAKAFIIRHTAIDPDGGEAGTVESEHSLDAGSSLVVRAEITVKDPLLWGIEHPNLYTIKTELHTGEGVVYAEENKTGIRTLEFSAEKGFQLNGKKVKLKGVCLHHAGGPLGAAIYERTTERQLEILREMGCNAVRTAHNPFSQEFLDVCDRMGFLVMNEIFDEWEEAKSPATTQDGKKIRIPVDYYAGVFKDWADRDLTDFILRDRNHPSVIMWSIGNEIMQMRTDAGAPIGRRLADIVHSLDYRPVTNGVNGYGWGVWPSELAIATSDILGYNYITGYGFDKERKLHPDAMAVVTECANAQSFYPRGIYLFEKNKKIWWDQLGYKHDEAFHWVDDPGMIREEGIEAWRAVKEREYVMGQFIWTGWDYLGEVIPFGWPARSSCFAPIDLCGFPKDGFYFYQSQWSDKPMVHIFPHWNLEGHEGEAVTVYAYTNGDEVELFHDGVSLGKKSNDTDGVEYQSWEVVYHPGELKAVAYREGDPIAEKVIVTTGKAARLELSARRSSIKSGGQDLVYLECSVLDQDGNVVPGADDLVTFSVDGPAVIAGVGNGNSMSHESFTANQRKAFHGKCLAIIKSELEPGEVVVTASSEGLGSDEISITIQ